MEYNKGRSISEGLNSDNWLQAISGENQLGKVINTNQYTKKYGLILDEKDAQLLLTERQDILKNQ